MKDLRIRDTRTDELQDLLDLNQAHVPHVGSVSLDGLVHLYNEAVYFRVAESKDRIMGFLIALEPNADYDSLNFLWFRDRYKSFVYIDRIAIAPEGHRKGIASRLYQDLESYAITRKIPIMVCEYNLRPKNEISRLFHGNYGFKEVGRQNTEQGKKLVSLQIRHIIT